MRKVFSSQRAETVESVGQLLREGGIEVCIRNGHSWRGRRRGQFSYLDHSDASTQPSVWIVHAEDQVQARQLLRAAGLLESTRSSSAHPVVTTHATAIDSYNRSQARRHWLRLALLILISVASVPLLISRFLPPVTPISAPAALEEREDAAFRVPIYPGEE